MILQLLTSQTKSIAPYCRAKVALVLLQNGVYAATKILHDYPDLTVYALHNDWLASGLEEHPKVRLISAQQWVELCALQHPVITIQHAN